MHKVASCRRATSAAVCLLLAACATSHVAPAARPDAAALKAHRAWWQAYAAGDQATLAAHTASDAEVVFGSGARLPGATVIVEAGKNKQASGFTMVWSDESVRFPRVGLAVVTATSTERAGSSSQVFRITTVLDLADASDWEAVFIQSTRVARFAPEVPTHVSGPVGDYAGAYSTPKGRLLRMEARDGSLWMVEPDGKGFRLTATGPGLFEPAGVSPLNGVLRFLFARDASGKVISFSRLTEGHVDTFPRAE